MCRRGDRLRSTAGADLDGHAVADFLSRSFYYFCFLVEHHWRFGLLKTTRKRSGQDGDCP